MSNIIAAGWAAKLKQPLTSEQIEHIEQEDLGFLNVSQDGTIVYCEVNAPFNGNFNEIDTLLNADLSMKFTYKTVHTKLEFDPIYCLPYGVVHPEGMQNPISFWSAEDIVNSTKQLAYKSKVSKKVVDISCTFK